MYDLIKRKHDQTPTPEKRSSRNRRHDDQQEESDNDEDEEDDDDDEDEDDDGDGEDEEGEEEKGIKGYELRKRRMIPNRYIAPPLKSKERGNCLFLKQCVWMMLYCGHLTKSYMYTICCSAVSNG